jgi:hypothetical protein
MLMKCSSRGPRNNGLIKNCTFVEEFPDKEGYNYNCPICNGLMKRVKKKQAANT